MSGYNPSKSTWLNPDIEYLFDQMITEYDMHDAGFSLIKQYRLLPEEKIKELSYMPKQERVIKIGMLQRDNPGLSKALLSKFAELRTIFISANNLSDNDIISVKKDAIFAIGECKRLKFGTIEFMQKNRYTSYIRFPNISNLEIYYSSNSEQADVKGMGESAIKRHQLYMLSWIRATMRKIESKEYYTRKHIMDFITEYKSGALDKEYYLEFNNLSRDLNAIFNYTNIIVPFVQVAMKEIPFNE